MLNIQPQYAYLSLSLAFLVVWAILFIVGKHTRREQFWMSILTSPLGTIGELFFFVDYWQPLSILSSSIGPIPFLVEDFIFMFSIAGIGTTIYKIISKKKTWVIQPVPTYRLGLVGISSVCTAVLLLLWFGTDLNSIFVASLVSLTFTTFVVVQRRDLLEPSFYSGLFFTLIIALVYMLYYLLIGPQRSDELLQKFWLLYSTSLDIRLLQVPLTELIWAFSTGASIGSLYAFAAKRKIVPVQDI